MKENIEEIKKWIAALRSGVYPQIRGTLQDKNGYCCFGVAHRVLLPKEKIVENKDGFLLGRIPSGLTNAPEWLRRINRDFLERTGVHLMWLNDIQRWDFNQIADALETVYVKGEELNLSHLPK